MSTVYLDIETVAMSADACAHLMPERLTLTEPTLEMVEAYADSLPSNWKPDTRQAKAEAWASTYDGEEERRRWMDDAALDPTRSTIYSYSAIVDGETRVEFADELSGEHTLIDYILREVGDGYGTSPAPTVITWNGHGFDLPFVQARCALLGRPVPRWKRGRYYLDRFIDAQAEVAGKWGLPYKSRSLDYFLRAFGLEPKVGSGKDFAGWDRAKQLVYARQDVEGLKVITEAFGLV